MIVVTSQLLFAVCWLVPFVAVWHLRSVDQHRQEQHAKQEHAEQAQQAADRNPAHFP